MLGEINRLAQGLAKRALDQVRELRRKRFAGEACESVGSPGGRGTAGTDDLGFAGGQDRTLLAWRGGGAPSA